MDMIHICILFFHYLCELQNLSTPHFSILVFFIVSVMVFSFQPHALLFNFDYDSLGGDGSGTIDLLFFVQSQVIQLFFIFFTFAVIFLTEAKFNRLDLRSVYKSSSKMEIRSRFIIFIWEILCLLSIVTLLPVIGSCEKDDICTCKFHINKASYGCSNNATIYTSIF